MNKIRIKHKDGDKTAITMIYIFYNLIKKNKELWNLDKDDYVLNRYYKGILTKTIKVTETLIHRFEKDINYIVEKDVLAIIEKEFNRFEYPNVTRETDIEILKTMFCAILLFDTTIRNKKKMIGVVLKSMVTDIVKVFNDFVEMWIRDIDDNIFKIED